MAEAIGLIASVIQVAGAGLKLSQSLYQYADGVATADRRIKDIAKEIELTSFVIEELGNVFKQDETSNLISKNAVKTAEETMKECLTVFSDIDATLKKSKKNTLGRLMLPFRDNKIELLRNHIDKLKSTLQLLMQVLTHAYQVASNKIDRETETKQRDEIKELLENKKRSTKRYEESLRNLSVSDTSTIIDDEQETDKENDDPTPTDALTAAASAIGSTINPDTLGKCVQHIRDLLEDIETLQQALTKQVDGDDHSEHHQSLIGSYFRARTHLDSVLFGRSKALDTFSPLPGGLSTTLRAKVREVEIDIQNTTTGITPKHTSSPKGILTDAEFNRALQLATEKARVEEREKMKQEAEDLRAEKLEVQRAAEDTARSKAEMAVKAATSEAARSSPAERQAPIKFQDTLGRKYIIPFYVCSTWQGMHNSIKEAYINGIEWKQHVHHTNFSLMDDKGSILLPKYWDLVIQPGAAITMQFWPECVPTKLKPGALDNPSSIMKNSPQRPLRSLGIIYESDEESSFPSDDLQEEPLQIFGLPPYPYTMHHPRKPDMPEDAPPVRMEQLIQTPSPEPYDPYLNPEGYEPHLKSTDRTHQLQAEIDATVGIMRDNINKVGERGERLESLQGKTDNLAISAETFRRAANRQRSLGLWGNVADWFSVPSWPSAPELPLIGTGGSSFGATWFGFGSSKVETNPVSSTEVPPTETSLPSSQKDIDSDASSVLLEHSDTPDSKSLRKGKKGKKPSKKPPQQVQETLNARAEGPVSASILASNSPRPPPTTYADLPFSISLPRSRPRPPPQSQADSPRTSATYIPSGDSFGSGAELPPLSTATEESFGSHSLLLPWDHAITRCGLPRNPDTEESEYVINDGDRYVMGASESEEVDDELLKEVEVDELLMEWTNVFG